MIYDINAFLNEQNKRLPGINSKTKPVLIKIIKDLKIITKHYTAAEKKQIAEIKENEQLKHFELERLKRLINKYIDATNNEDVEVNISNQIKNLKF